MRVLLLSRYGPKGASSRVRSYQYLPYLEANGVSVEVSSLFGDEYLDRYYGGGNRLTVAVIRGYLSRLSKLRKAHEYDLLWIEKEIFPWLPAILETWSMRRLPPVFVDYDDAIFHRYDRHRSILVRMVLGKKIDQIMRRARIVVTGNEYLAERARKSGADEVSVIPTVVDLARYRVRSGSGDNEGVPIIGWIGSPSTVPYLEYVMGTLRDLVKEGIARVRVIGAGRKSRLPDFVELRSWSEQTEVEEIKQFDIGVMPLPDSPWERGKCGYKLIQYMACGLPVVASPVGVNSAIIENGLNGWTVRTQSEWSSALRTLLADSAMRNQFGAEGRRLVEKRYSLSVAAPRLIDAMKRAAQLGS